MCVTFLHKTVVPVDTGRKLNVHKTFNVRPASTGVFSMISKNNNFFQGNEYHHQSNIQITCSDVYALEKKNNKKKK